MCQRKPDFEVLITVTAKHDTSVKVQVQVEHKDSVCTPCKKLSWNSRFLMQCWPLILTSVDSTASVWHPGPSPSPDKLVGKKSHSLLRQVAGHFWTSGSLHHKQLQQICSSTVPFYRVNMSWGIITIITITQIISVKKTAFCSTLTSKLRDFRRLFCSTITPKLRSFGTEMLSIWCNLTGVMELGDV